MSAPAAVGSTATALRWSAVSLLGRQGAQLAFAVVLARLLGPDAYGLVSAALAYITIGSLVLDQGLAAALIQRPTLDPREPGAAATLNLALALALGAATAALAPTLAGFFHTPDLAPVVAVLGAGLVLKALAIVPRALLSRRLDFKVIALADTAGAAAGGAVAVAAALSGAGYWALVAQTLAADAVVAAVLLGCVRGPRPNAALGQLSGLMSFGTRVFIANLLSVFSRNADNILVGRYLGTTALAYYSIAYRVLLAPVQMLGFVVTRVLFPSFARMAEQPARIRAAVQQGTGMLAILAFPLMALIAVAAPQWVPLLLGRQWSAAVLVIQILAVTGARQCVYSLTPALMTGLGRADLHMRFAIVATVLQLGGIVAGLPFGIVGVAVGYGLGGVAATPLSIALQRRLVGIGVAEHLGSLVAPLHAAGWVVATYLCVSAVVPGPGAVGGLAVAGGLALGAGALAVRLAHPRAARQYLAVAGQVIRGRRG